MKPRALKLGIVGGLGARAGADILNELVKMTPVKSEGDHREISFEQKPMVEGVSVLDPAYSPTHRKFYVFDTLTRMQTNGCEAALLPCFITHTFLQELRAELNLNLVSMTEALRQHLTVHHPDAKRIGVLTTPFVRHARLIDTIVAPDCTVIYPDDVANTAMLKAIYGSDGFKAGGPSSVIYDHVKAAIKSLIDADADVIVPAMTEIPIILRDQRVRSAVPVLRVNEIYAQFALAETSQAASRPFKVGVIGGVGPAATVDFMSKLVGATQASKDQDHIKILVEQNPQIPDRTSNLIGDGVDPTLALYSTARKLMNGGADIVAIPCNTAHAYVERIQRHLDIPIINMLSETANHIQNLTPQPKNVGILATSGTIQSHLYQDALMAAGLNPLVPDANDQGKVMEAIYGPLGVKAGYTQGECAALLLQCIDALRRKGADVIILGCTELPLISLPKTVQNPEHLIDPTLVLATSCIAISRATVS
jgi:aspartate racemase